MPEQEQFLQVLDRDEAERRFRAVLDLTPRGIEQVPLDAALGRVLAAHVVSPVDVPSFDRSNVDGFAVVAEDTFGASEEVPRVVLLGEEEIHTGIVPATVIHPGKAVLIATGGMVPRGADAVVMVEHAEVRGRELRIARAVTAGSGVSFAGTDITAGETVLRRGRLLTSRDTGVLAAIGVAKVKVWRKPIVAILSTGDEIIAPGEADATRQGLRLQRPGAGRRRAGIGRRADATGHYARRSRRPARAAASRAGVCGYRAVVRWNQQGRGRRVLSRCRRTQRSRDRRARRGAQARQADLPRGDSRPRGGGAAGFPDLGDLHLPRVRGAGDSLAGGPRLGGTDHRTGQTRRQGQ